MLKVNPNNCVTICHSFIYPLDPVCLFRAVGIIFPNHCKPDYVMHLIKHPPECSRLLLLALPELTPSGLPAPFAIPPMIRWPLVTDTPWHLASALFQVPFPSPRVSLPFPSPTRTPSHPSWTRPSVSSSKASSDLPDAGCLHSPVHAAWTALITLGCCCLPCCTPGLEVFEGTDQSSRGSVPSKPNTGCLLPEPSQCLGLCTS